MAPASIDAYELPPSHDGRPLQLGIAGEHQKLNASLAVQAARAWIRRRRGEAPVDATLAPFALNAEVGRSQTALTRCTSISLQSVTALESCRWPGRSQVARNVAGHRSLTFFLDGAHTRKSIAAGVAWFADASTAAAAGNSAKRVLLFTCTGGRDALPLLDLLHVRVIADVGASLACRWCAVA